MKEKRKKTDPYLTNLNEDPILSYVISYFIGADRETRIGRAGDSDIRLNGLNILSEHAVLVNTSNKASVTIRPCQLGAKIKVNGVNVDEETRLKHKDRVLIGSSAHMYVFINPTEAKPNEARITWEMAQTEIAEAKGLTLGGNRKLTLEQQRVQEQIIELISIISDVNAIAEELNKHRLFEVVLVPAVAYDDAKPNSTDKRLIDSLQSSHKIKTTNGVLNINQSDGQDDQFAESERVAVGSRQAHESQVRHAGSLPEVHGRRGRRALYQQGARSLLGSARGLVLRPWRPLPPESRLSHGLRGQSVHLRVSSEHFNEFVFNVSAIA